MPPDNGNRKTVLRRLNKCTQIHGDIKEDVAVYYYANLGQCNRPLHKDSGLL